MNKETALVKLRENVIDYLDKTGYIHFDENIKSKINPFDLNFDSEVFIKLDSAQFNKINELLYVNLYASFYALDSLKKAINTYFAVNKAQTGNMKTAIEKIKNKLEGIEKSIEEKNNPTHFIETFADDESLENNMYYYKERYGEVISKRNVIRFDKYEESLTLPAISIDNKLISASGSILGDISLKYYTGKNLYSIENKDKLINIIDTSMITFWQQTILVDTPIKIEFDENYYNIKNGALCELELSFESKTTVNEIALDPFTKFPIEILGVRYKETDDDREEYKNLISPNNIFEDLRNKVTDKSISYKFETIVCKKMNIIFRQIHYTRFNGNYNTEQMFKNRLWYNLVDKEILEEEEIFKPFSEEKNINNKLYEYLSKASLEEFNSETFNNLLRKESRTKFVSKYQYDYGFYNISAFLNDFSDTGIYVSKLINANSNISSISLLSEENHPVDAEGRIYTDIEYYITTKDTPKLNDWISIFPKNKEEVYSELLQKAYGKYTLRFPALEIKNIYFNGIALRPNFDYYTNLNSDGFIASIDIPNADPFSTYTANYIPVENSKVLNFSDNINYTGSTEENIYCTGSSFYRLLHVPVISESSNITLSLVNIESGDSYTEENGYVVNVTNRITPKDSYKNFRKGTLIQYYVDRNYIYINQEVSAPFILVVNYDSFVSTFRLKAIMRRNTIRPHLTPSLYKLDYEVHTVE